MHSKVTHRIHGTGISTYIYHKHQPNVGNYTIHGSYGQWYSGCLPLDKKAQKAFSCLQFFQHFMFSNSLSNCRCVASLRWLAFPRASARREWVPLAAAEGTAPPRGGTYFFLYVFFLIRCNAIYYVTIYTCYDINK